MNKICRLMNRLFNTAILKRQGVEHGDNIKINGRIFIQNGGEISIGNDVKINSSIKANPTSGVITKLCTDRNGKVKIGNRVGISNATIFAFGEITIEDDVDIGAGAKIFDSDFHSVDFSERKNNVGVKVKPVKICEGAFIGAEAIILKGVTVGKHSVVGAGSVVTKNIPDYEIWGGNPARYIGICNGR
ncbi:MAG: acyltransferase [Eubacteriales bacterium]|nr:acyltransferase [Eubacteriales bacterium]